MLSRTSWWPNCDYLFLLSFFFMLVSFLLKNVDHALWVFEEMTRIHRMLHPVLKQHDFFFAFLISAAVGASLMGTSSTRSSWCDWPAIRDVARLFFFVGGWSSIVLFRLKALKKKSPFFLAASSQTTRGKRRATTESFFAKTIKTVLDDSFVLLLGHRKKSQCFYGPGMLLNGRLRRTTTPFFNIRHRAAACQ